jgi:hypothetical protein
MLCFFLPFFLPSLFYLVIPTIHSSIRPGVLAALDWFTLRASHPYIRLQQEHAGIYKTFIIGHSFIHSFILLCSENTPKRNRGAAEAKQNVPTGKDCQQRCACSVAADAAMARLLDTLQTIP